MVSLKGERDLFMRLEGCKMKQMKINECGCDLVFNWTRCSDASQPGVPGPRTLQTVLRQDWQSIFWSVQLDRIPNTAGYIMCLDILHILYHYIDILILNKIFCLLSRKKVTFLTGIAGASQLFGLRIDEPLIAVKPFPVRL